LASVFTESATLCLKVERRVPIDLSNKLADGDGNKPPGIVLIK